VHDRRAPQLVQVGAAAPQDHERRRLVVVDRRVVVARAGAAQHQPGARSGGVHDRLDLGVAVALVEREGHGPRVAREHVRARLEQTEAAVAAQVRRAGAGPPGPPVAGPERPEVEVRSGCLGHPRGGSPVQSGRDARGGPRREQLAAADARAVHGGDRTSGRERVGPGA
jgi:hypothetical protein